MKQARELPKRSRLAINAREHAQAESEKRRKTPPAPAEDGQ